VKPQSVPYFKVLFVYSTKRQLHLAVFSKARNRVEFQGMALWGPNSEVIKSDAQDELIFYDLAVASCVIP